MICNFNYSFFYLVQRFASHLQVFALSKWLAVTLPVEYYELARGLQWSIPYFKLPWETGDLHSVMVGSTSSKDRLLGIPKEHNSIFFEGLQPEAANTDSAAKVFGLPLSPMEYASYFEVRSNYFYSNLVSHFSILIEAFSKAEPVYHARSRLHLGSTEFTRVSNSAAISSVLPLNTFVFLQRLVFSDDQNELIAHLVEAHPPQTKLGKICCFL